MNIRIMSIVQIDSGTPLTAGQIIVPYTWRRIDASRWADAVLVARMHSAGGTWSVGSTVIFECAQDGYTDEDPSQNWNLPSPGGFGTLATFTQTDTAPIVRIQSVVAALGSLPPLLLIRVKFTAGGANQMKPTLSADLNFKSSR